MKFLTSFRLSFIFLIFQFILFQSLYGANRYEIPPGVHYHRFASLVEGPEASWVNPAALGYYRTISAQITGEIYDGSFGHNWGFNTVGDGVGISYRHLNDFEGAKYNEYIFGLGLRVNYGIYVGGSYRYVKDGPIALDGTHNWNIGLLVRQNPKLYMAAVFSNLNREEIAGEQTDIEQLYSISGMPFGRYLMVSAEMSLSVKQSISGARKVYGAEFYPSPGIIGYINFDNDENYELGIRVNLTSYFVGLQSRLASGGVHHGTSLTAGVVSDPQPSIIRPPGKYKK
ncbi:MAG: hypothetical protein CVT49_13870 [candidate division Zixibacteria bacterium HGW-Zixibacteria-1]|nr:MAG: hypothetical protein CVT49_13870 [candidate division Zixibacteria bacterium HGW-Zixibacteria-1]